MTIEFKRMILGDVKAELAARGIESASVARGNRLIAGYRPIISVFMDRQLQKLAVVRHYHQSTRKHFELADPDSIENAVRYVVELLTAGAPD